MYQSELHSKSEMMKYHWKISFLNVSSLYAHLQDVARDNYLMDSDVFSLGETWLHQGTEIHLNGYNGIFANYGPGKGVAAFVHNELESTKDPITMSSEFLSVVKLSHMDIDMIFVYVSKNCKQAVLEAALTQLINTCAPTIVIGDFNEHFCEKSKVSKFMKAMNFDQKITEATHDKGNTIDHLYVNNYIERKGFFIEKSAAYYSDHDILSIYVQK